MAEGALCRGTAVRGSEMTAAGRSAVLAHVHICMHPHELLCLHNTRASVRARVRICMCACARVCMRVWGAARVLLSNTYKWVRRL